MVAMKGDQCVTVASDKRFGIQAQTISFNFPKVFEMGNHLYVGLPGLATDTRTVVEKLRFRYTRYIRFYSILSSDQIFSEKTCTS